MGGHGLALSVLQSSPNMPTLLLSAHSALPFGWLTDFQSCKSRIEHRNQCPTASTDSIHRLHLCRWQLHPSSSLSKNSDVNLTVSLTSYIQSVGKSRHLPLNYIQNLTISYHNLNVHHPSPRVLLVSLPLPILPNSIFLTKQRQGLCQDLSHITLLFKTLPWLPSQCTK